MAYKRLEMTKYNVDDLDIEEFFDVESPLSKPGRPIIFKNILGLRIRTTRQKLYGCGHCNIAFEKPAHVRVHMKMDHSNGDKKADAAARKPPADPDPAEAARAAAARRLAEAHEEAAAQQAAARPKPTPPPQRRARVLAAVPAFSAPAPPPPLNGHAPAPAAAPAATSPAAGSDTPPAANPMEEKSIDTALSLVTRMAESRALAKEEAVYWRSQAAHERKLRQEAERRWARAAKLFGGQDTPADGGAPAPDTA